MSDETFPTDSPAILARLDALDPGRYASTRNFLDGAVTRLSPYLTHGFLTLPQVRDAAYARAGKKASYKLVFELAWREFYQRTWEEQGDAIFSDLRQPQEGVRVRGVVPAAVLDARTGISAVDASVTQLYETGWTHNHARMWTAMLTANVGGAHWQAPADWYHYHLLDGDPASNALSWQWVAGAFSAKKYVANQENLNKYDPVNFQRGTFLDRPYEDLLEPPFPKVLEPIRAPELPVVLPEPEQVEIAPGERVLLYHPFSLDPLWHAGDADWKKILVLEPTHFARFPRSERRMEFLLALARNIPGLSRWVGDASGIPGIERAGEIRTKSHPAFGHFPGVHEPIARLFPGDTRSVPGGFMAWWRRVEKDL